MRWLLLVIALTACRGNNAAPASEPEPVPVSAPVVAEEPAEEPSEITPASLYAQCQDRVEQPQKKGECSADTDCAAVGCGKEVCTVATAEIMTTCEERPCFAVLDACGCHEGACTWTLKDEVPPMKPIGEIPQ